MLYRITITFALLSLIASCGLLPQKGEQITHNETEEINQGLIFEKDGDYRKAVALWQGLHKADPQNPYYLYHLGWNYSRLKEYAKAERYLKQSTQYDPTNVDALLALGYIYMWTDHYKEAAALFTQALKYSGSDSHFATKALEELKQKEQLFEIERVKGQKEERIRAGVQRAEHFEREGDYHLALMEWQKLSIEDPANGDYPYHIGRICLKLKEYEKAKSFLKSSLALDETNIAAKVALGYANYGTNDLMEAKELFDQVLIEDPDNEEAQKGLILVSKKQKEDRLAIKDISEKQLRAKAENVEQHGRENEALMLWMALNEQYPDNPFYLFRMGQLYFKKQESVKAEKYLLKSVRLDPRNADGWLQLGELYIRSGRNEKAAQAFEQVLKIYPDKPAAVLGLKRAHEARGP